MINKKNTREPSSVLFSNIVTNGIFQTLQEIKKQGGIIPILIFLH